MGQDFRSLDPVRGLHEDIDFFSTVCVMKDKKVNLEEIATCKPIHLFFYYE
jgi:hypothetical protein